MISSITVLTLAALFGFSDMIAFCAARKLSRNASTPRHRIGLGELNRELGNA